MNLSEQEQVRIAAAGRFLALRREMVWGMLADLSATTAGREMLADALDGAYRRTPSGPVYAPKGSAAHRALLEAAE